MVSIPIDGRVPVAMTIAGSDSGGGAGIEADLKTFAALGVHGTAAITAITAQNTKAVTGIQDIEPGLIEAQIEAVVDDIGVDAAKTGMLHTSEIIRVVSRQVNKHGFPLVVDPVMVAKSGATLLRPEAKQSLIEELLPLATVLTPNAREAEEIVGREIPDVERAREAAEEIASLGPTAVVVKGGHLGGDYSIDVVYHEGTIEMISAPREEKTTTHGTGCAFSAAIAAGLAMGKNIIDSVRTAKEVVTAGIRFGIPVGAGHGPVNPMVKLYKDSERWSVLKRVKMAVLMMERANVSRLIPEVGTNVAMAIPYAERAEDVAAVPGRLRATGESARAVSSAEFGASSHLASYILEAMRRDPSMRAAINLRYSEGLVEKLKERGLLVSGYDRRAEPKDVKEIEGGTVPWGMRIAIEGAGRVPDVVYHLGDWGKEPMVVLLGRDPVDLVGLITSLEEA